MDLNKRPFKLPAGSSNKDYVDNTLIVKFKDIHSEGSILSSSAELPAFEQCSASITHVRPLFQKESSGRFSDNCPAISAIENNLGLDRIVEIKYASSTNIEEIINEILKNKNVEYAEPRYIYHNDHITYRIGNDIHHDLKNQIQEYLLQVHAPEAWKIPINTTKPVIIAIVDTGSQLDHPDLASNIHHNEKEISDNGMDDDGDGYIDNCDGWDFGGESKNNPGEDNNPNVIYPENSHGIHVSGLAAAITNHDIGIASIANPHAQLLIIKASTDDDPTHIPYGYEGIKYAADHGAKIINCSWEGPYFSAYGQNIINYAIQQDCLIIAAAGNEHTETPHYPASYDGVMSVASVSNRDRKSSFSNYGRHIAISAPGEYIYSTILDGYDYMSGTSMAAPIVSSTAALIKAKYPSLTMKQIADHMKATADPIDQKNAQYIGLLGRGRLNVYRALTEKINILDPKELGIELMQNYPNPAKDNTTIAFTIPQDGQTYLTLYSLSGTPIKELLNTYLYKGSYRITVPLSNLPDGIYPYRLQFQNTLYTLKLQIGE